MSLCVSTGVATTFMSLLYPMLFLVTANVFALIASAPGIISGNFLVISVRGQPHVLNVATGNYGVHSFAAAAPLIIRILFLALGIRTRMKVSPGGTHHLTYCSTASPNDDDYVSDAAYSDLTTRLVEEFERGPDTVDHADRYLWDYTKEALLPLTVPDRQAWLYLVSLARGNSN